MVKRAASRHRLEQGPAWTILPQTKVSQEHKIKWKIKNPIWLATSWWFSRSKAIQWRKVVVINMHIRIQTSHPMLATRTTPWCIWVVVAWEMLASLWTCLPSANCRCKIRRRDLAVKLWFQSCRATNLNLNKISKINGSTSLMMERISKCLLWPIRVIHTEVKCNNRTSYNQEGQIWCSPALKAFHISKMRVLHFHFRIVQRPTL